MKVMPHRATDLSSVLITAAHAVTDVSQGAFPALIPFITLAFSLSYSQVGVLVLIQSVTSSVCQPLFGYVSDKSSKSWFIPVGVLLSGVAMGSIVWAPNYAVLVALISISGIGSAIFHPQAMKAANRISPPSRKGERIGLYSFGGNLGFAVGAFAMGWLLTFPGEFSNAKWIALPAILFTIVLLVFNRNVRFASHVGDKRAASVKGGGIPYAFLSILILFIFMRSTAYSAINTYTPLFHVAVMGENSVFAGNYVSVFSIAGVLGTYFGGILSDRMGRKRIIMSSMLLTIPLVGLIPYARGMWAMGLAALTGFVLVASFSSTLVMAQESMRNNMGLAAGLTVGFAIGLGGVGSTILGCLADFMTLPVLMNWFWILPLCAFFITFMFPGDREGGRGVKSADEAKKI